MSKVKFTTTIDEKLLEDIKIVAVREKCSVSSIIEQLLWGYVIDHPPLDERKARFTVPKKQND